MSPGRPRKPVSEDKLTLKRLAAKLRQRRCRERKKACGKVETKPKRASVKTKAASPSPSIAKETIKVPLSPPCKTRIVHVPVPAYFGLPPFHHHPMYMPHPMTIAPGHHHVPLHPRDHLGYTARGYYYHDAYSMMSHRHHSAAPDVPVTAATTSAQSDTIPRTVSRSFSDASTDNSVKSSEMSQNELDKKKKKKTLESEEKTAVAAILSLMSNSSDEDSSDGTVSTSDGEPSLATEFTERHSTIMRRTDNAQSVFRVVQV